MYHVDWWIDSIEWCANYQSISKISQTIIVQSWFSTRVSILKIEQNRLSFYRHRHRLCKFYHIVISVCYGRDCIWHGSIATTKEGKNTHKRKQKKKKHFNNKEYMKWNTNFFWLISLLSDSFFFLLFLLYYFVYLKWAACRIMCSDNMVFCFLHFTNGFIWKTQFNKLV